MRLLFGKVNCDTENPGTSLDANFHVDFSANSGGASTYEMRYPGGDVTSDIWV